MKIFKIIVTFWVVSWANISQGSSEKLEGLAILVPSCDKYAEAWPGFFHLLDKYWPQNNLQNIYLIGGKHTYEKPNAVNISIPNDKGWANNVLEALDHIKEDYVFIILEDYYLKAKVDHEKLSRAYTAMKSAQAASLVLAVSDQLDPCDEIGGLAYVQKGQPYRVSLQAVIWEKKALKHLLKDGESPWEFEIYGTTRSNDMDAPFLSVTDPSIFDYIGAISRGHWTRPAIQLIKKEGLKFPRNLPEESVWRERFLGFKAWISEYINQPIKKMLGLENKILLPGWF